MPTIQDLCDAFREIEGATLEALTPQSVHESAKSAWTCWLDPVGDEIPDRPTVTALAFEIMRALPVSPKRAAEMALDALRAALMQREERKASTSVLRATEHLSRAH